MTASPVSDRLDDDALRSMLTEMIGARFFSNRAFNLQRQGRAGTNAPIDGNEGVVVGAARALDPATDWVLPQYREPPGLLRFGEEVLRRYFLYIVGHPSGSHMPEPLRVWPPQISLATQIPHAVGQAWGMQIQRQEGVVLVFFGDGASSEGDFYEAGNLAGVLGVPVILMCVNNGWAISTPTSRQTAAGSFADKARAFGIPGVQVDGTDVLAVYEATAAARERAAAGEGPTLIEAVTYRLGPHTTADDPSRYVPPAELERARERDPVVRFRQELRSRGLWDDEAEERAQSWAGELAERIVAEVEATPVSPTDMFDHVFAEPTPALVEQRSSLVEHLARTGRDDV